jgi:phosphodiesterase/alkaline phosphatase D-like protein
VAPSNLGAPSVAATSVRLTWTDNSNNELSFAVERSTSSNFANPVRLVTLNANTTTFTDAPVVARTTYYYRVIATNAAGSSASGVIRVTTPRR